MTTTEPTYCPACDEYKTVSIATRAKITKAQEALVADNEWKNEKDICWDCLRRHQINDLGELYTGEEIREEEYEMSQRGYRLNPAMGMWVSSSGGLILSKVRQNEIKLARKNTGRK